LNIYYVLDIVSILLYLNHNSRFRQPRLSERALDFKSYTVFCDHKAEDQRV
jgi:hypothetical protein